MRCTLLIMLRSHVSSIIKAQLLAVGILVIILALRIVNRFISHTNFLLYFQLSILALESVEDLLNNHPFMLSFLTRPFLTVLPLFRSEILFSWSSPLHRELPAHFILLLLWVSDGRAIAIGWELILITTCHKSWPRSTQPHLLGILQQLLRKFLWWFKFIALRYYFGFFLCCVCGSYLQFALHHRTVLILLSLLNSWMQLWNGRQVVNLLDWHYILLICHFLYLSKIVLPIWVVKVV